MRLADRSLVQTNPLLAVADRLLALAGGRATASEVLDIAQTTPVRSRFGFTDDGLEGITRWVRQANIRLPKLEVDERMCFLPLCHIAERIGGAFFAVYTGSVLNFVERPETVPENVREIAPTVFTAVPRVWEKLYSGVTIALKDSSKLQQAAYAWGIGVGT